MSLCGDKGQRRGDESVLADILKLQDVGGRLFGSILMFIYYYHTHTHIVAGPYVKELDAWPLFSGTWTNMSTTPVTIQLNLKKN